MDKQLSRYLPVWLFWTAAVLATLWFTRGKRGAGRTAVRRGRMRSDASGRAAADNRVIADYMAARRRREALLGEAGQIGRRLQRLGRGLSEPPRALTEHPAEWDLLSAESLPTARTLAMLTDAIRNTARRVDDLRERLLLMGRSDLIESPDAFFR